ncbi:MAG: cyclophilin-like fold protein [Pirellulaceae bacterium]|nr:cyclophilin-like fold protein [Pirellulaceae bacterium]
MPTAILITVGETDFTAELNDSPTALDLVGQLPIESPASRWGDELYFSIPVDHPAGPDARDEMAVGELAYWPPGNAVCIFFGPTPVSHGNEPRAADACNVLGHILDNIEPLSDTRSGDSVTIRLA